FKPICKDHVMESCPDRFCVEILQVVLQLESTGSTKAVLLYWNQYRCYAHPVSLRNLARKSSARSSYIMNMKLYQTLRAKTSSMTYIKECIHWLNNTVTIRLTTYPRPEATDDGDKLQNCSTEEKGYEVNKISLRIIT
ncbi:hypothetical protein L9F63_021056, partial [Diploptera punctata]